MNFTNYRGGEVQTKSVKFHTFFYWVLPTLKTFDLGLKLPFYLLWKVSGGGWVGGLGLWYQPKSKSLDYDFWFGLGLRLRLDSLSACKSLSPLLELILCPRNLVFILINICVHLTCLQPQNLGRRLAGVELSCLSPWLDIVMCACLWH